MSLCCSAVGLPIHLHTLLPTLTVESTIGAHMYQGVQAGSRAHLHCRKDVYQHAGIWLRVFSDYDGFYDGCDEWAMKVRLAAPVFPLLSCWTYPTRPGGNGSVLEPCSAAHSFPTTCSRVVGGRGCTNCAGCTLVPSPVRTYCCSTV